MASGSGRSLRGTHLSLDDRGIYHWRRVDPITGRMKKRSTGTRNLEIALRKAQQFEEDHERRKVGLHVFDCWKKDLKPLAEAFLEARVTDLAPETLRARRHQLLRALDALDLRRASDLDDLGRLDEKLRSLERAGTSRPTLKRCFQDPLKQFTRWLAASKRHLDRDPLEKWATVKVPGDDALSSRAMLPDELARTFVALDRLDEIHGRTVPQRPFYVALLIAGPRVSALTTRLVHHLLRDERRIDLGESRGNKRKGAARLDTTTFTEIEASLGARTAGPLFLSPDGGGLLRERVLDVFREAFSFGIVDALWPGDLPRDLSLVYLVSTALRKGRARVSKGGNPKIVRKETVDGRAALAKHVDEIAARLRPEWERRMNGIRVHGLRRTHKTYAEAAGVPGSCTDIQLGWRRIDRAGDHEILRLLAGSETSRAHYLDVNAIFFDPRRSAEAVRKFLDDALTALLRSSTLLIQTKKE